MRAVRLDISLEDAFIDLVSTDPVRYHSFLEAKLSGRGTIFLAIEEDIRGMMFVSEGRAELDGNGAAVRTLFDLLPEGEWTLSVPAGTALPPISGMRRSSDDLILRLSLGPRTETPPAQETTMLDRGDADEISSLLAEVDPVHWSRHTPEAIQGMMDSTIWLGARVEGRLVSVGCARVTEAGSNIYILATRKGHRGMGLGRSLLSSFILLALKKSDVVMIHVLPENVRAMGLYRSMGFRPHHSFRHIVGLRKGRSEGSK
jgi:ribosomal protein S18 acetylase RimI-like enzyme